MSSLTVLFNGLLLIVITTSMLAPNISRSNDWKLQKDKNGIQVFTRKVEGQTLKEAKASITLSSTPEKVKAFLFDFDAYPKWSHTSIEGKLLEKKSEQEIYSYSLNKAPWPVSNRDVVVKNIISEQSDGTILIKVSAVPDFIPEKKSVVRIPYMEGYWKLTPKSDHKVEVTYQFIADPGGSIPSWLANATVVDTPFKSLDNMRKLLEAKQ